MKKYFKIFLIIFAASLFYVSTAEADITTGLVGHWKFDEGSGTSALDSSASGNNGALINGPTWTAGKIGQGLSFDGFNDYVNTGIGNLPSTNALQTFSLWVYRRNGTNGVPLSIGGNSCNVLYFRGDGTMYKCGDSPVVSPNVSVSNNVWTHIVYTFDGTTNKLYKNGSLNGSSAIAHDAGAITNSNIGKRSIGSPYEFDGIIDDVRVYSRALSAADILELFNTTGDTTGAPLSLMNGLVAWWKLDGNALDNTGTGNSGTLFGGPTFAASPFGQALNFDGVDDFVGCGINNLPATNAAKTLSLRIFRRNSTTGVPLSLGGYTPNDIYFRGDGGIYRFADNLIVAPNIQPSNNAWTHIVYTFDGANNKLYLNGVPNGSSVVANDAGATKLCNIGKRVKREIGFEYPFNGLIDDVRIYNRALSGAEVLALYNPSPIGDILAQATLDGAPWSGNVNYTVTGPENFTGTSVNTVFSNKPAGLYTLTHTGGGPANASLSSISPAPSQNLFVGTEINYTMNFISNTQPSLSAVIQAENMLKSPASGFGQFFADGNWQMYNGNGWLEQAINFPSIGNYKFVFRGFGNFFNGAWSSAELRIDSAPIAKITLNSSSYANYEITANVPAGNHVYAIALGGGSEIIADKTTINFLPVAILAACSAFPTSINVGESSRWTASVSGGTGGPYTYTWSGTDNLSGITNSPVNYIDHTYLSVNTSPGHSANVNVSDGSQSKNTTCSNTVQGSPVVGADLMGRALGINGNRVPGQAITFSGDVFNLPGKNTSGPSTARICIDNANCLTGSAGSLGEFPISALSANTNSVPLNTSNPWIMTPGTHTYYVCADIYGTNSETDETNNCGSQTFTATECSDGVDNIDPEDNLIDTADPGCHADADASNPASYNALDDNEANSACSDPFDNDGDGANNCADPGCHTDHNYKNSSSCDPTINNEFYVTQCEDIDALGASIDNDGDGKANSLDPGCHWDGNVNNPNSYDKYDNSEGDLSFREVFEAFTRPLASLFGF